MADLLIPAYAVWFLFVSVVGIRAQLEDHEPQWVIGRDVLLTVLALGGYFSYHLGLGGLYLALVWKAVAPLLIGGYAVGFWNHLKSHRPDPELSRLENIWVSTVGTWLGLVTVLPALWFNLRLGYG